MDEIPTRLRTELRAEITETQTKFRFEIDELRKEMKYYFQKNAATISELRAAMGKRNYAPHGCGSILKP